MSDWSMIMPITEQEVSAELSAANLVGGSDIYGTIRESILDDALNWVQAAEVGMEVQRIADYNNQLWEYLYLKTTDGWVYKYRQLDQED